MKDRIIAADNNPDDLESIRNILTKAGKVVTAFSTGTELLEHVRDCGFPNLILMDIDLPEADGFETMKQLKGMMPPRTDIPVILLSADRHKETETRSLYAGAVDFIRKPVDPDILISRVQKALNMQDRLLKFEKDAETDLLTGFLNKSTSDIKIAELCQKQTGMLCAMDLDSFKSINDIFGHDTGDRILIMFARLLKETVNHEAEFGRIGGDEFIAFIRDMTTEDELCRFTEKLNAAYRTEAKNLTDGRMPITIGISIGAVNVPEYGRDYENLFHLADQSLYFVKQNGKHSCKLFNPSDPAIHGPHRYLDLDTITAILEERDASPNAMWMGNEVFSSIYRYMVRYMDRYHAVAYRVLFTVKTADNTTELQNTEIMIQFRKVIQNSLRNSDVMMDCGENQLFLLLPEVREYDIDQIINRLLRNWSNSEYSDLTKVTYETGKVHSQFHPETELQSDQSIWVIIVDDDESSLESTGDILRAHGMLVTLLKSGQELIDMTKEHKPDLILLDLHMADMDGFETMRQLRIQVDPYNDIPVIFFTEEGDGKEEVRCLKLGAMDFIRRPLSPEVLIQRVIHTIELKHLQNNLAATVHRKTQESENLSMHVLHSLTEAIDAKDQYTNSHSTHVAEYAKEISRRYGYTETKQEEIYLMGLLHDIGKIGIPDAIINKPGKLSFEEYELIKNHPIVGAKILENIEEMPTLSIGARWHHEWYNGNGYPDGLAGEDIPEEARIIALADAYDAMTSNRSYRGSLPQEIVRAEISKGIGVQFDPKFAAILIQMIDDDTEYKMRER